ncbi:fasciclin domain-containing protein [Ancylobacter sp. A5.8]|uniref:fasciclin domain-containing protein n=1 Tax=Ancylobacter gelatini TaxID=2919920 RepID=UPI001F4D88E5|nr:fasciclin domain-containing protein [Ancylobacter gelatini]MCJ8143935.1 fasciclin domain-containing protein [Ancylobacter gelatini]
MFRKVLIAGAIAIAVTSTAFADKKSDIVSVAVSTPELSTLVAAVKAAGLVDTLSGAGPFTVFAPTNAAFAALPAGTVEELLKPENKAKLTEILTFHVVPGKVMAADLKEGMKAKTVEGEEVTITLTGGPKVNGANVTMADVSASNGVVHVIDKVILPKAAP